MNQATDQKRIFAQGRCGYKYCLIFIIGCLIGTWYEEILTLIRTGHYENRSGVMYGPFNPVYGAGMLLMVIVIGRIEKWYHAITYGAILGGTLEYLLSLLQEIFTGAVSWDYSNKITNIDGRTTVIYALFWGLLGFVIAKILYPFLSNLIEKLPYRFGKIMTITLMSFLILDMFVSYSALVRRGLRERGIEPFTPIGEFYDSYYTDERIQKLFPNMRLDGLKKEE